MSEPKAWRLWIDGEERTDECDALDFGTPALVYDAPRDTGARRSFLGPRGFWVKVASSSERLLALADGGREAHDVRIAVSGLALPVRVHFLEQWAEGSGVRRMFGCLAHDSSGEPLWVDESVTLDSVG